MPYLLTETCCGRVSHSITEDPPKLVGSQHFVRESMTRCLSVEEISETDAWLGIDELVAVRRGVEACQ